MFTISRVRPNAGWVSPAPLRLLLRTGGPARAMPWPIGFWRGRVRMVGPSAQHDWIGQAGAKPRRCVQGGWCWPARRSGYALRCPAAAPSALMRPYRRSGGSPTWQTPGVVEGATKAASAESDRRSRSPRRSHGLTRTMTAASPAQTSLLSPTGTYTAANSFFQESNNEANFRGLPENGPPTTDLAKNDESLALRVWAGACWSKCRFLWQRRET
jgi:hypothetical protein